MSNETALGNLEEIEEHASQTWGMVQGSVPLDAIDRQRIASALQLIKKVRNALEKKSG